MEVVLKAAIAIRVVVVHGALMAGTLKIAWAIAAKAARAVATT